MSPLFPVPVSLIKVTPRSGKETSGYPKPGLTGICVCDVEMYTPPTWTGISGLSILCSTSAHLVNNSTPGDGWIMSWHSKWLRLLLFWTPATVVSMLGIGFCALIVFAWLHVGALRVLSLMA
jgi:hypothetical protein